MPAVQTSLQKKKTLDRILALIALLTIGIAWFAGAMRADANLQPYLKQAFPAAERFERLSVAMYAAYKNQSPEQLLGHVSIGAANGYGGELRVAVAVDLSGKVIGLVIIDHKETPSYLARVLGKRLPDGLMSKSYSDAFQVGQDVDAISGATYTVKAIAEAVRKGSREVAVAQLGKDVPPEVPLQVQFGVPELLLILLFAIGFWGHQSRFKFSKPARWVSMIVGMVGLGFVYNNPLTLNSINRLLMGFFPEWQTHLYWYLLIGGILLVFTVDNKNPYCEWFCPFGAAQECLGAIGGAKVHTPPRYRDLLVWVQRFLAWLAIVIALWFRHPGISSYEIFGTLFSLTGSTFQFMLLGLVLIAALFIKRPWCTFLCPLRPVTDFIRLSRTWIGELWQKLRPKPIA